MRELSMNSHWLKSRKDIQKGEKSGLSRNQESTVDIQIKWLTCVRFYYKIPQHSRVLHSEHVLDDLGAKVLPGVVHCGGVQHAQEPRARKLEQGEQEQIEILEQVHTLEPIVE